MFIIIVFIIAIIPIIIALMVLGKGLIICPNCYQKSESTIKCEHCSFEYEGEYYKKVNYVLGFITFRQRKRIKFLSNNRIYKQKGKVDFSAIYINTNNVNHNTVQKLILHILAKPPVCGIENIKVFIKGKAANYTKYLKSIVGKRKRLDIQKIIFDFGYGVAPEKSKLIINKYNFIYSNVFKSIFKNCISKIESIFLNIKDIKVEFLEELNTFLVENVALNELKNIQFYLIGDNRKLDLNTNNSLKNIFNYKEIKK